MIPTIGGGGGSTSTPDSTPAKADANQRGQETEENPYAPFPNTPEGMYQYWEKELAASRSELKDFHAKSADVLRMYLDKRGVQEELQNHINLFWSTVDVLKASLYARVPKVDVSRLFRDQDDDVARVAGNMLERILNSGIELDGSPFNASAKNGIEDWLIIGLGQLFVRYDAQIGQNTIEPTNDPLTGKQIDAGGTFDVKIGEDTPVDYCYWRDFFWQPCRTWEECGWVAKRVYMTKGDAEKRFGKDMAALLNFKKQNGQRDEFAGDISVQQQAWEKAEIFEIWCKLTKRVYWFSYGMAKVADFKEDPLQLENFFPCPCPLAANTTTTRFMPKADYAMAKDLFKQINELQNRIAWLTKACKVAGLYDKNSAEIKNIYKAGELTLIGVDNWAAFAERGGVQGQISFLPIEEVGNVIALLRQELAAAQQHVYEVLGISDIMRGASNPNETLGAQEMKAQFGASRIQTKQAEIAAWIAATMRIKAEVMSRHYSPETLIEESNIQATPDAQYAQQAVALLKDWDKMRWRITVDPETIAALDWAKERDARTQFLEAVGQFMQQMVPLATSNPTMAPFLFQLFKWAMGGFKVSKEVEGIMDQALNKLQEQAAQPQQPSAQQTKEQAEAQDKMAAAGLKKAQTQAIVQQISQGGQGAETPTAAPLQHDVLKSNAEATRAHADAGLKHAQTVATLAQAHKTNKEAEAANIAAQVQPLNPANGNPGAPQ